MKLASSFWFALAMSALGLIGSVAIPVVYMHSAGKGSADVVSLTALALGGVLSLIAVLALVAATFSALKLTDPAQALGLPEGTIRAVIALSLIMIFVISALFIFGKLTETQSAVMQGVTAKQLELLPQGDIIKQVPEANPAKDAPPTYDVTLVHLPSVSKAAEDFARQVVTMVGTLVVSIASFYFGAQSVQTAVSSMQNDAQPDEPEAVSGPEIGQLEPKTLQPPASQTDQTVVVTGKDLANVTVATLAGPEGAGKNDVAQLSAIKLVAEADKLTCVFTVPPNIAIGDWKLVLETKEGAKVEKQKALSVQSQPDPIPTPS